MHLFYRSSVYPMGEVCVFVCSYSCVRVHTWNGWSLFLVPLEVESHLVSISHWPWAECSVRLCVWLICQMKSFFLYLSLSLYIYRKSGLVSPWTSSHLSSRPRSLHRSSKFMFPQQQWNPMLVVPPTVHLQNYTFNMLPVQLVCVFIMCIFILCFFFSSKICVCLCGL